MKAWIQKYIFTLKALSAAHIVREKIDTEPILGSRIGDEVSGIQMKFDESNVDSNRMSGCIVRLLASFGKSTAVWNHIDSITWFACPAICLASLESVQVRQ